MNLESVLFLRLHNEDAAGMVRSRHANQQQRRRVSNHHSLKMQALLVENAVALGLSLRSRSPRPGSSRPRRTPRQLADSEILCSDGRQCRPLAPTPPDPPPPRCCWSDLSAR